MLSMFRFAGDLFQVWFCLIRGVGWVTAVFRRRLHGDPPDRPQSPRKIASALPSARPRLRIIHFFEFCQAAPVCSTEQRGFRGKTAGLGHLTHVGYRPLFSRPVASSQMAQLRGDVRGELDDRGRWGRQHRLHYFQAIDQGFHGGTKGAARLRDSLKDRSDG